MRYWQTVFAYFVDQGIPKDLLSYNCISPKDASQIIDIIEERQPKNILEVGTFIGLSTGVIALASSQGSTLVCVDPNFPVTVMATRFNYSESRGALYFVRRMLEYFGKDEQTTLLEGYFSCLSTRYMERFAKLGGEPEKINIIGDRIGEFAPYDLAFLDGDHSTEAVYSDLSLMHKFISVDGTIILHDVSQYWGKQVYAGITKFLQEHPEFSIRIYGNLGYLSRNSYHISLQKRARWRWSMMVFIVKSKIVSRIPHRVGTVHSCI